MRVTYLIDQQASETLEVVVKSPKRTYTPIVVRELVPIVDHEQEVLCLSREVALELANMLHKAAMKCPEITEENIEYPGMIIK